MPEVDSTVLIVYLSLIISLVLFVIFFSSRYYKFKTNEYVIHLRNGKVRSAGRGGKVIKLPLIDEIVIIPTTTRQTALNSREKVLSREYQDLNIIGMLYWRVANPTIAFNAVVWDRRSDDYVEKILKTATEAIIRTTCASLEIEEIIRDRHNIIELVTGQLHNLTSDWGIVIESFEILEVKVLDEDLKLNMEAVKKSIEQRKARIAAAEAEEQYRMKEIEVREVVGVKDQQTNLMIAMEQKNREIKIQEQEKRRIEIEAEAEKRREILRAEARSEAVRLEKIASWEGEADGKLAMYESDAEGIRKRMDAEAEGTRKKLQADADGKLMMYESDAKGIRTTMDAEAEGTRKKMIADADGKRAMFESNAEGIRLKLEAEAEGTRKKMQAEADGLRAQTDAMNLAGDNMMALKLIETLPNIFENLKPEKMIMMGQGNESFNGIVQSLMPFLEILPVFSQEIKKSFDLTKINEKSPKITASHK